MIVLKFRKAKKTREQGNIEKKFTYWYDSNQIFSIYYIIRKKVVLTCKDGACSFRFILCILKLKTWIQQFTDLCEIIYCGDLGQPKLSRIDGIDVRQRHFCPESNIHESELDLITFSFTYARKSTLLFKI